MEEKMYGLMIVREVNKDTAPLKDQVICCCTTISAPMAVFMKTLVILGAKVRWCSSNVNTAENEIAAAVVLKGISVYGWSGQSEEEYWWCMQNVIDTQGDRPHFIVDIGGDLTNYMLNKNPTNFQSLNGIVEVSSIGVARLYMMAKEEKLHIPAMNISNCIVFEAFRRLHQSRECLLKCLELTGDLMCSGKKYLICGYGHRGKNCCKTLRMYGATVYVTEIDPICALNACLEGIEVVKIESVIELVDGVILCTGNSDVLGRSEMEQMKNGAFVLNNGHTINEVDMNGLKADNIQHETINQNVLKVTFASSKSILILFHGQPMQTVTFTLPDVAFSVETTAMAVALIELNMSCRKRYTGGVYLLPRKLDEYVALIHLNLFSANLTYLTAKQAAFISVSKDGPYKSQLYKY